ncbi:MAG: primosomal protein N' [Alteromonadaceae bacterium]|nr:primosomal protein N' [Alteromonadaceae bacterium]
MSAAQDFCFVEVALPVPMRRLFDYRCPKSTALIGARVRVPFGKQDKIGLITGVKDHSQWESDKLKSVVEVLDDTPVIDSASYSLLKWASNYYCAPIGEALFAALPANLRNGKAQTLQMIKYWQLAESLADDDNFAEACASIRRAPKQQNVLLRLKEQPCPHDKLRKDVSLAVINALTDKGWIEAIERVPSINDAWATQLDISGSHRPNVEQALAISGLNACKGFSPFLLEGVTGSGKTEVFLQSIERHLLNSQQVLILVPEISLTPQTIKRFESRFGIEVDSWHSGLTDNERHLVWQKSRRGEAAIVVGTRSAVFLPFKNLGMIIVDEEHDSSFKQQDGFRYHARDLAIMRAKELNIPILLASATPSLESLNNALTGRYQHLQLSSVAVSTPNSSKDIIDMRQMSVEQGISEQLKARIHWHLQQNQQVLLFVNRRGYAPAIECADCGHVEMCKQCDNPFTVHKSTQQWHCHYCGAVKFATRYCSHCGSNNLKTVGFGTEKIEEKLNQMFPEHNVARIDSDAVRSKSKLQEMLDKIHANEYHILVGTQILAKGHHFPNIAMVAIIDVDNALFSADFRGFEYLAQLITQVSGRTGRAGSKGEMWLQSSQPEHPLLQDLLMNGYSHFARTALPERRAAGLPPFHYQVLIRTEAVKIENAVGVLQELKQMFHMKQSVAQGSVQLIGPFPALVEKKQGRMRMQLLLSSGSRQLLHRVTHNFVDSLENSKLAKKVRWSVDVDPVDFY